MSSNIGKDGMLSIRDTYLKAVWMAGGRTSLLYPDIGNDYIEEIIDGFDGFIFCGGGDIDAKFYGEKNAEATNICSLRDDFECRLFIAAYSSKKAILGICRGMQIINVFLGGSLHQNIYGHMQNQARCKFSHSIYVEKQSFLYNIVKKEELKVNSFHHQAINSLSAALAVNATSSDGYIEAYSHKNHPFLLGVQWHPEACCESDVYSGRIFAAFIDACGK